MPPGSFTTVSRKPDAASLAGSPAHAVARASSSRCARATLQALLWQRARDPFAGSWALPGGRLEPGETLEQSILRHLAAKVDVREVAHLEQLETRSDPDRNPGELGARDRLSRPRAGGRRPRGPGGHELAPGRTAAASSPSTTSRSCSPAGEAAGEALLHERGLRARAARRSRSRSSARSTAPRSATTSRRRTCSGCCCGGTCWSATGERQRPGPDGRPAGGALPLPLARRWRSPTRSPCCDRRPELSPPSRRPHTAGFGDRRGGANPTHVLPAGAARGPRLRLLPAGGGRRGGRRRPEVGRRGLPRARDHARPLAPARARDAHARRPRLRPGAARPRALRRRRAPARQDAGPRTRDARSPPGPPLLPRRRADPALRRLALRRRRRPARPRRRPRGGRAVALRDDPPPARARRPRRALARARRRLDVRRRRHEREAVLDDRPRAAHEPLVPDRGRGRVRPPPDRPADPAAAELRADRRAEPRGTAGRGGDARAVARAARPGPARGGCAPPRRPRAARLRRPPPPRRRQRHDRPQRRRHPRGLGRRPRRGRARDRRGHGAPARGGGRPQRPCLGNGPPDGPVRDDACRGRGRAGGAAAERRGAAPRRARGTTSGRRATSRDRCTSPTTSSATVRPSCPDGKPLAVACSAGNRSALAASLLRRHGVDRVLHVAEGGVEQLPGAGIELVRE